MNLPAPFTINQKSYFDRCFRSWFNVAEGGKRGGKNVLQTLAFCANLEIHPNRLHLIAGVSTTTARLNILDCDGYGMMNFFEGRCRLGQYQNRDCLYVRTKYGEKIILVSGGGKNGDEKLIKGNTYGMAYLTEANECHPNFIREVFDRTLSSANRKIFHDLNPKSQNHWYYTDVLDFHEAKQNADPDYGYNYGHFTIADNMSISDERLKAVIATYDKKSVWYQRDILGKRKVAQGLVYPLFSRDYHLKPEEPRPYQKYYVSCDYGTMNPCSMGLWGLCDGKWYRIKEYYYSGRNSKQPKTDEEYYEELVNLTKGVRVKSVIVDPSAASFLTSIKRHGKFHVIPAENDVLNGIRNVATCLKDGLLFFNECCTATAEEFESYMWDEKAAEDAVIKENDHAMDDIRYFVNTVIKTEPSGWGFGTRKI